MYKIILKRRAKVALALIIVCLGISVFLGHKLINKSNYTSRSLSKATTMKEAINIAYKSAKNGTRVQN